MADMLRSIGDYALPAFIVMLAIIGIYTQVRNFLDKDRRDEKSSKYQDFVTTIELLKQKLNLQEGAIEDLTEKVRMLEKKNAHLLDELNTYSQRANHYFALFATRCPYEQLTQGKAYCDFFHPLDRDKIREDVMSSIDCDNYSRPDMGEEDAVGV